MEVQQSVPSIETFVSLVRSGVELWIKAGETLVQMVDKDPSIYARIISQNSFITFEMLLAFEKIGRHQIYPPLLLDSSKGAKALLGMPYLLQEKYSKEQIEVAALNGGGEPHVERKYFKELDADEIKIVFSDEAVRTVDQQREVLRKTPPKTKRYYRKREKLIKRGTFRVKVTPHGNVVLEPCEEKVVAQTLYVKAGDGFSTCVVEIFEKKNP